MFGGIFPSQWSQPLPRRWKPIKNFADHQFPSQPSNIPIKIKRPKEVFANSDLERAKNSMPPEELCLNEAPIDTTEIDEMLEKVFNPSPENKAQQIFQMMATINQNLSKNINALQNSPAMDGDNVSKEDLLKKITLMR